MKLKLSDIIVTKYPQFMELVAWKDGIRYRTKYSGWSVAICKKMFLREIKLSK